MGSGGAPAPSTRRGPEAFFAAGYRLLGEGGHDNLTVAGLCDRLDVSKGSFYHHFDGMADFVDRFATSWQAWAERLFHRLREQPDAHRQMEFAANEAFVIVSPGVRAMRAWATTDPVVAGAFAAPERLWWDTVTATFGEAAQDEDSGRITASMNYAISLGLLARPRPLDRERYVDLLAVLFGSYGVTSDVTGSGRHTRLQVLSWDRSRSRSTATGPWGADLPAPAAAAVLGSDRPAGRGARRVKDDFFLAAAELLGEHDAGGITITALVDRLGLSTGSFQHHFGSMPAFVEQFAAHREHSDTRRVEGFLRERDPYRRMELLHADLLLDPDPVQTAWRAWGHTNPVVGAAIARTDDLRQRALAATIDQLVAHPDNAAVAELTLAFALGLHRGCPPPGTALRAPAAVEWMRRVVGLDTAVHIQDGLPRLAFRPA